MLSINQSMLLLQIHTVICAQQTSDQRRSQGGHKCMTCMSQSQLEISMCLRLLGVLPLDPAGGFGPQTPSFVPLANSWLRPASDRRNAAEMNGSKVGLLVDKRQSQPRTASREWPQWPQWPWPQHTFELWYRYDHLQTETSVFGHTTFYVGILNNSFN